MRKTIVSTLLAASCVIAPVGAFANEETLVKADALIREGKPADAYALLDPLEAKLAGDPTYDYLLATAALQAGNPSRATFIYERILAANPEYVGVRADMGRAYYQMGDLARAKLEFEAILALTNVPPDLRTAVETYKAAVDRQQAGGSKFTYTAYVESGFGRDSNVLAQTSSNPVRFYGTPVDLTADQRKRADSYLSYGTGGEALYNLDGGLSAYGGGDFRGRLHNRIDQADNYTADGRVGLQYTSGRYLIRAGYLFGRYFLDNASTRDSQGASLDGRYLLNEKNQLTVNTMFMAYRYNPDAFRTGDNDLTSVTLGWTHLLAPTTVAVANLTFGGENATGGRQDGDKHYWGVRGTFQHSFSFPIGIFVTAGQQWANYTRTNETFDIRREDRLSDVMAGLVWSLPDRWSIRPLFSYTRNWSNEEINKYNRRDYSVVLRKDF